jgi:hypothetical protein
MTGSPSLKVIPHNMSLSVLYIYTQNMKVMCNKTIKFCPGDKVVLEEAEGEDFGVKQYVSLW